MRERRRRWRAETPEIQRAARALRKPMTPAETALWEHLRRRRLDGISFRRQYATGRFVLDFYAPREKLGIEVDGDVHDLQKERDDARTDALALRGIRIVRFRNEEVLSDIEPVLARIRWEIAFQRDGAPEV
jgi:very-short-patch-repair endonuclease